MRNKTNIFGLFARRPEGITTAPPLRSAGVWEFGTRHFDALKQFTRFLGLTQQCAADLTIRPARAAGPAPTLVIGPRFEASPRVGFYVASRDGKLTPEARAARSEDAAAMLEYVYGRKVDGVPEVTLRDVLMLAETARSDPDFTRSQSLMDCAMNRRALAIAPQIMAVYDSWHEEKAERDYVRDKQARAASAAPGPV